MKNVVNAVIFSFACAVILASHPASAQTAPTPPPNSKPSRPITYRGMEMGVDVTAGRTGEVAFYMGASSTRGSLAVRFGMMDAVESVPCSVGIMYEYLFGRDRARITPVAGTSFSRVFSCASDSDGFRPTPTAHSISEFSGGVRVPIFASQHVVGSLRALAFVERQLGLESASDVTSKGVTVGFVIGRR